MSIEEIYEGALEELEQPPKPLFKKAIDGAIVAVSYAEILLNQAIREYGEDQEVKYPDTAYYLPVMTALSGEKVETLGELPPILNRLRQQVREEYTFENARLAGEATLYAAEIIEALRYVREEEPHVEPWSGFLRDPILRKYGIQLVDWSIPGQTVILGRARSSEEAAELVRDLQSKGMMLFIADEVIEQLLEQDMKLGVDYIAFPVGNFTQVIHAVNFALRAGLAFGGMPPGERDQARDYQYRRVRCFVLHLGEIDDVKAAAHFGAIFLGFAVITDQELQEGMRIPDWYESEQDYKEMVKLGMELRGIKIETSEIDAPITVGPAFEGETIRRGDMHAEFGGKSSTAFEVVRMVEDRDEIEDGKVIHEGPDLDEIEEGGTLPLGIIVDVYGRKMQRDFEGVLERRVHGFTNYGEGLWHVAQRDFVWIRVSKDAYEKGFRMKHLGEILKTKLKEDFSQVIDRIQVTIITDENKVNEEIEGARERYRERDEKIAQLNDESVDTFYSCLLCQSFAPNHVCVITPDRVGLCGAISWLDAKASNEMDPHGPNQPIPKDGTIDEEKGMWEAVNEAVYKDSNRNLEEVNLYTLMEKPMTSCGCFEAIIAMVPEANGVMITTRDHGGMTPCGMNFSTLAGSVGGGVQTPGFMGVGRTYMLSPKFIKADGGLARVIWMPKSLKEFLGDDLRKRAEEDGLGEDFVDKIADEEVGETAEEILSFLQEKDHPALSMDPMM
ncbi:acetyl-CoA decarbonylase/synthase complex subunit alpha/beta [Natranaerofaba carboxydovora]|uniref:acetyl-CoA decarbonylase/synthase complex subunit alpha/beta n=1 Tax=Natranaerofaba carboxydovora TaxID=2742683 RepID=UPI001F12BD26|nr:acetyl-CoA decarbonylase/synthase complex subunit alpha/beta [Natranaerofaba carboxydovora]UMZ75348.1 Carbon monoxide dehydrogenase/acetyl-CoA synthase subunit alpha [Natranaerofaba carboxydovora]